MHGPKSDLKHPKVARYTNYTYKWVVGYQRKATHSTRMSVPIQNPKSHQLQWSANHMHLPFLRAQTIGPHLIILILRRSSKEWDKLMMQPPTVAPRHLRLDDFHNLWSISVPKAVWVSKTIGFHEPRLCNLLYRFNFVMLLYHRINIAWYLTHL